MLSASAETVSANQITGAANNVITLGLYFAENGTTAYPHYACERFPCHFERSEESFKQVLRYVDFLAGAPPRSLRSNLRVHVKENLY